MEKEKKTFDLTKLLNVKTKPKKSSKEDRMAKHVPSWMYRNE